MNGWVRLSFFAKLAELENILPSADFIIEGYVDPTEPLCDESPSGHRIG